MRIWDAKTGEQINVLSDFTVRPRAVAFSPDGKLLAVGSDYAFANRTDDRTIRIWDTATFREVMTLKGHRGDVVSLEFSPDSKRLASASWDNTARIWDLATGRESALCKGHENHVWSACFSPDGHRLATGGADQTVRIWDADTGKDRKRGLSDRICRRAGNVGRIGSGQCAIAQKSGRARRTGKLPFQSPTGRAVRRLAPLPKASAR